MGNCANIYLNGQIVVLGDDNRRKEFIVFDCCQCLLSIIVDYNKLVIRIPLNKWFENFYWLVRYQLCIDETKMNYKFRILQTEQFT